MNSIAMDNLLNYLQGLQLTASNRKWLADKLIQSSSESVMSDDEIRDGLTESFKQLEELKTGKRKGRKAEELLYEL